MIAWLRKPAGKVSAAGLALLVTAGFVILHLFLARAVDLYIDHDELQYGQHAVLILDGLWEHIRWERPNWREGFPLLFGPLVTPFFAVLDANLTTLRVAYVVFAGGWTAAWVLVARHLAPRAPVWAVAGLFILPTPFISRYSVSSMAMSTHLGVSTAHGFATLLLLGARDARGALRWMRLLAAGMVAGFGAYGGLLMAVLLPGVILGAAMSAGLQGLAVFVIGTLPGLALAFFQANPFAALNMPDYVGDRINLWAPFEALLYAAGYLPPQGWQGNYLPTGLVYFGFIAVACIFAYRARVARPDSMLVALVVSAACLLGSLVPGHHTPWGPTRFQWDSLRYTAPLLPIAVVLVLASCSRFVEAGRRGFAALLAAVLLVAHAVGFLSHVSWRRLSEDGISSTWVRPYLRFDPLAFPIPALPDSERRDLYTLRQGMAAFQVDNADASKLEARARTLNLQGNALQEYWRGVGRSQVLWRMTDEMLDRAHTWDLPADVREAVWQGIGMEAHLCDYEHRREGLDRFIPATGAERAAYAWGWARVCTDDTHAPALSPALSIDRRLGRRLRWDLDLAVPGAPPVSDEHLKELIFKQWVP